MQDKAGQSRAKQGETGQRVAGRKRNWRGKRFFMAIITTLKKNSEFLRLYKRGKFYAGKYLVLYVKENGLGRNRIGITANRKFGGSVRRNRIRRLIRENYRKYGDTLKQGFDFVFVARAVASPAGYHDVEREMRHLLNRGAMLRQEQPKI